MSDPIVEPNIPPALGPGDDHPASPAASTVAGANAPLGPGDDDPQSPARVGEPDAVAPANPGDGPESEFAMLAPPAAGPGDVAAVRHLTRIPKRGA